ncbi:MFS transporter [uncultured Eubacterium sp.]|uniref:MFS transporter n=1 Tax=uncultured Eubacterium sp. TaxID=165185 RepID=UPI0025964B6E|nr:glycoside-pentoside-hexuronide (GPH):cation symporter [uncultured Eubacterium sp.]
MKNRSMQRTDGKISLWEKFSYSGGDVASCITFGAVSSYLSYYYTDIAGISIAAVGLILGITRLIEALVNFLTGVAIDGCHFKRGKVKPFMYATTIPLMVMFVLNFCVPDLSSRGKIVFAFFTYLSFCVLYAINNTGYGTLLSLITCDVRERRLLNSFKVFGSSMGNILVSFLTLPLVALCGVQGRFSFAPVALIYGIVSLIFLGNCTISCKERVKSAETERMNLKESLRCAVKSRSWILLCVIGACVMVVMILQNQSIIYYAKYVLFDEKMATVLLTIYTATQLLAALFMEKALTRLGNRNCMLFGFGVFLVLTVVMFACRKNLILFCIFMLLAGLGKSMATSPCYAICADTVDEVESLTGKRPQGVMMSFMMCTMKAGTAIAGVVFSAVLHAGHYAAEAAQQSPEAIRAIYMNLFWLPMLIVAGCMALAFFFKRQPMQK